jgi:uncharacterized phage protein (TIGR01671 family)
MIPKFRAWDKKKKMLYSFVLNIDEHGIYWLRRWTKKWYWIRNTFEFIGGMDDFIIMQSSGLRDKSGREVFEGDIIQFGLIREEVLFTDGSFRTSSDGNDLCCYNKKCEVIGNVYENPELLKGAKIHG